MAFLFLLMSIAIVSAYFGYRKTAISCVLISFVFNYAILYYHMTDTLRINW